MKRFLLIKILLMVFIGTGSYYVNASDNFPKRLTASDAIQYFSKHQKIQMRKPGDGFDFVVKGNDIERDCAECHTTYADGSVNYKGNKVCFDWEVSFPPSGCFNFVQVSQGGFELQNDHGEMVYAWGNINQKVVIKSGPAYTEKFERAILIDLDDMKPTQDKLYVAVIQAMKNKGWRIEKKQAGKIIANYESAGTVYRVMAKVRGSWVGIGFIQGYAHSRDGWLYNIQKQLMIQLGAN